jgi:hypothetical protein
LVTTPFFREGELFGGEQRLNGFRVSLFIGLNELNRGSWRRDHTADTVGGAALCAFVGEFPLGRSPKMAFNSSKPFFPSVESRVDIMLADKGGPSLLSEDYRDLFGP